MSASAFEGAEYTANADALGVLRLLEAIRILGMEKESLVAATGQDRQLPPRASNRSCVAYFQADSRETSLHSSQHDLD
jgi:hypothetical protein